MTAAKLNIEWHDTAETAIQARAEPVDWSKNGNAVAYTRSLVSDTKPLRCPSCESIVYSRRSQWCGACGEKLPSEYQFSPSEAQRIENLLRVERERYRKWRERMFNQSIKA